MWETIGVDRLRGVYPENDSYTADEWGSSKCSFDLHRDPGAIFPDLQAFTPIDVEIGGALVWSGRIIETPIREGDRIFNVQGQGWQYHLDDDVYEHKYVHTKLGDYKDQRQLPQTDLTKFTTAGRVVTDGALSFGWAKGDTVSPSNFVGVVLDLGPNTTAGAFSLDFTRIGGTVDMLWVVRGSNTGDPTLLGNDGVSLTMSTMAASGTSTVTFPVFAPRYVHLLIFYNGANAVLAADAMIKLTGLRTFAALGYQSSGASVLKAPVVINDALDRGTILLSADRSMIDPNATVTFSLPEFALDGQHTPREIIQAANAVHDYQAKIDVYGRMVFNPRPSTARVEIGAWPGSVFDDASANSGDDIYNLVVTEGTGPDKQALSVTRTAGQAVGAPLETISSPAPGNPSFAVDASTWTASSPALITRNTTAGQFDTAPAAGRWDRAPTGTGIPVELGDTLTETFTGTFRAGTLYVLSIWFGTPGPMQGSGANVTFGTASDFATARWGQAAGVFAHSISWVPAADRTSVTLQIMTTARTVWLVDSLVLQVAKPTLVDRRGFRRTHILPVTTSLNTALGQQIGDTWLKSHKTTPLKGTVQLTGDCACREILTGAGIPPGRLLTMTGELLRLSHRVDPDTGGHGRDGRIAEVTYTPETDIAVVAIDSRRTSHEALLERLAVVVGSG
ncbi:MAG TPA: hypothetical protein VFG87_15185 [Amycolatopsis sp.]|nr:hypothetical protein [Amycolatopsis sp.]